MNGTDKSSDSEYFGKAIMWSIIGLGTVIGFVVTILKLTGTLR